MTPGTQDVITEMSEIATNEKIKISGKNAKIPMVIKKKVRKFFVISTSKMANELVYH